MHFGFANPYRRVQSDYHSERATPQHLSANVTMNGVMLEVSDQRSLKLSSQSVMFGGKLFDLSLQPLVDRNLERDAGSRDIAVGIACV